jgi:hypothetical protein
MNMMMMMMMMTRTTIMIALVGPANKGWMLMQQVWSN